jgi:TPR repeat protein
VYYGGYGVKQDRTRAARLFQKACDGGDAKACYDLSEMYEYGDGVMCDTFIADELRILACRNGMPLACLPVPRKF